MYSMSIYIGHLSVGFDGSKPVTEDLDDDEDVPGWLWCSSMR